MSVTVNNLFSPSELRVMEKLCLGKLYKEIAHESHISINTVKKHLKNIYRKLEVGNRKSACTKYNELPLAV
jgi:DNA-binding NarL/FixJ family response regulator